MNWELTRNILFGLGLLALLIGLLLRFKVGRWLLAIILLLLTLGSLLSGDWHSLGDNLDAPNDPLKASRYWLWAGALAVAAAFLVNVASKP